MSSDSSMCLDHRVSFGFLSLNTSLLYQNFYHKSLDSCFNIKTQDLKMLIPISISRLKV